MFCMYCGTPLPDEAKFCFKCGKALPVNYSLYVKELSVSSDYTKESCYSNTLIYKGYMYILSGTGFVGGPETREAWYKETVISRINLKTYELEKIKSFKRSLAYDPYGHSQRFSISQDKIWYIGYEDEDDEASNNLAIMSIDINTKEEEIVKKLPKVSKAYMPIVNKEYIIYFSEGKMVIENTATGERAKKTGGYVLSCSDYGIVYGKYEDRYERADKNKEMSEYFYFDFATGESQKFPAYLKNMFGKEFSKRIDSWSKIEYVKQYGKDDMEVWLSAVSGSTFMLRTGKPFVEYGRGLECGTMEFPLTDGRSGNIAFDGKSIFVTEYDRGGCLITEYSEGKITYSDVLKEVTGNDANSLVAVDSYVLIYGFSGRIKIRNPEGQWNDVRVV